jgi:hypothetical protein
LEDPTLLKAGFFKQIRELKIQRKKIQGSALIYVSSQDEPEVRELTWNFISRLALWILSSLVVFPH